MEFRDEAQVYDRLAVSVTGETLTEVYLEQQKALKMEERGGAQAVSCLLQEEAAGFSLEGRFQCSVYSVQIWVAVRCWCLNTQC